MARTIRERLKNQSKRVCTLFACACVRQVWHSLPDDPFKNGLILAEKHLDEEQSKMKAVARAVNQRAFAMANIGSYGAAAASAAYVAIDMAISPNESYYSANRAIHAARDAQEAAVDEGYSFDGLSSDDDFVRNEMLKIQRLIGNDILLPDNISLPEFRQTVLIQSLAQEIYHSQDYSEMPILADAREEEGSDDTIIQHCRDPFHVRGCWIIDLLLNKR